jgi:hypothetical protein
MAGLLKGPGKSLVKLEGLFIVFTNVHGDVCNAAVSSSASITPVLSIEDEPSNGCNWMFSLPDTESAKIQVLCSALHLLATLSLSLL